MRGLRGDDIPDDYPLPPQGDLLTVEYLLKVSAEKTVRIAELEAALARAEAELRSRVIK